MKNLLGKKFTGVKFNSDTLYYSEYMDDFIGVEGEIIRINDRKDAVVVKFRSGVVWSYPLSIALKQLQPVPEITEGVMMEVSDYKSFYVALQRLVYCKINGQFAVLNSCGSLVYFKYARPITKEISMQEIADKFGIDVNNLKIKK